jgi:clan AA aspartic protease
MIVGVVSVYREALVRLWVRGPQGQAEEIEAVVDTGFNGSLTLPSALIALLSLPYRRSGRALLADGSESLFDVYEAIVDWDGQRRRVSVDAVETEPLLGMALLDGYELRVQARVGGGVFVTALP